MNHKEQAKQRTDLGKKAGIVGIVTNICLAVAKLIVGILSSSVSIIADSLNNLMDAASSIVTLIGFKLAEKPADEVIAACRQQGVLVIKAKNKVRLLPALNIPMEQLVKAAEVIKNACVG